MVYLVKRPAQEPKKSVPQPLKKESKATSPKGKTKTAAAHNQGTKSPAPENKKETTTTTLAVLGLAGLAIIGGLLGTNVLHPAAVYYADWRAQLDPTIVAALNAIAFALPAGLITNRLLTRLTDFIADPQVAADIAYTKAHRFREDLSLITAADQGKLTYIADFRTALPERGAQTYLETQGGITPSAFIESFAGTFDNYTHLMLVCNPSGCQSSLRWVYPEQIHLRMVYYRYLSLSDPSLIFHSLLNTGIIDR